MVALLTWNGNLSNGFPERVANIVLAQRKSQNNLLHMFI
jgi:hypothetical protein